MSTVRRGRPVIRVLGPVDVVTPDGEISVGGHQPRALLAALVMAAGRAVPTDQLRWVMWGEEPPPGADATLQAYVSHLRQLLGVDAIVLTDHSYALDVDVVDIDAITFQQLVRQSDTAADEPAESWRLAREALQLWRGQPFGDLADEEAFTVEAYRLEGLRQAAMEMSIQADLALGHHELVVGELETAVRESPYREELWRLLIVALAQGGRRVEALRACNELRRTLGEIGVSLGPEFVELEQEILSGNLPEDIDTR